MKTPRFNTKKLKDILSRHIREVNSSRVHKNSNFPYCNYNNNDFTTSMNDILSTLISNRRNSREGDDCNGGCHTEIHENPCESSACKGIEQISEMDLETEIHDQQNMNEPTNDQHNFQTDSAFDTNDPSGTVDEICKDDSSLSTLMSNHRNPLEDDDLNKECHTEIHGNPCESPACIDIQQISEMELETEIHDVRNMNEPSNDQHNFQTDSAFDMNDPSGTVDEICKDDSSLSTLMSNHRNLQEDDNLNGGCHTEIHGNPCESPACIDIEQISEMELETEIHDQQNMNEPTNDQQNFQTDSAFDTTDPSGTLDEICKDDLSLSTLMSNHRNPLEDDDLNKECHTEIHGNPCESSACIDIEQISEMELETEIHDQQNMNEPTNDQHNFQTDSAFDTNDPSGTIDEICKDDDLNEECHTEIHGKPCEPPACKGNEQISEIEIDTKIHDERNMNEPTNDQHNFQTDSAFDTNDPSGTLDEICKDDDLNEECHKENHGNPCESPACIDIKQISEMELETEIHDERNMNEPTNDRHNFQTDSAFDMNDPSGTVDEICKDDDLNKECHTEIHGNPCESPACIDIEQISEMELETEIHDQQNMNEPTNDQHNFQTDSAFDTNDPSGTLDEICKDDSSLSTLMSNHRNPLEDDDLNGGCHTEIHGNPCESPARKGNEQISEMELETEIHDERNMNEPTNDQHNFQTDSAFDTNDPSGTIEDGSKDDSFVIPVHDSPINKTEEKNNQAGTSLDFLNIRVPVVVGEYKIDICLEETLLFEENIMWINVISNKIVLLNSQFIPTEFSKPLDNGMSKALKGNLFIEGHLIQNIEYTADDHNLESDPLYKDGKVHSITKKRPFSTFVEIDSFLHPPVFQTSTQKTFDFIDPNNKKIPQTNTQLVNTVTYYPEQPYCRLICSEIHEYTCLSEADHATNANTPIESVQVNTIHKKNETNEKQLNQKTVLVTFVHLLQEQHVKVRYDEHENHPIFPDKETWETHDLLQKKAGIKPYNIEKCASTSNFD
ncbi:DUF7852 domain-containing protein [Peribacillus huizhouensis]|uniref:DUF7852 domain-containing protein n=1 Tax=Peribacillus huizhouensis TaxID=1501239 RepID=A0ABR6CL65_9BACI|nr:hypothetical protein [Peribacillus huizhouensis]MBA9025780.1 hypothetical protein [Peribacillus huizhouensis]